MLSGDSPELSRRDLELLADPDGEVNDTLLNVVNWIFPLVKMLTMVLDPGHITLAGGVVWQNRKVLSLLEEKLNEELWPKINNRRIMVVPARVAKHCTASGAAFAMMSQVHPDQLK